ncbi:MAG TPA: hypothetical protein VM010_08030, partial [Chitinophagaceae bacterium]|nr:hypothetical protein [Chitinophagaceae bacterium]
MFVAKIHTTSYDALPVKRAGILLLCTIFFFAACTEHKHVGEKEVVAAPVDIDAAAADIIETTLEDELDSNTHLKNFVIFNPSIAEYIYEQAAYKPIWSKKGVFAAAADSLFQFIADSRTYGLFPEDYYKERLAQLKQLVTDTTKENKLDASKWAEADLLFTAAFINIIKDIKMGRLVADSISKTDTTLSPEFYHQQLQSFDGHMHQLAASLEPTQPGYVDLKWALQEFLQHASFADYTFIDTKDSLGLKDALVKRLDEEDSITFTTAQPDSAELALAIKRYQAEKGLKETGKASPGLYNSLNNTDNYKFARIAINLDRYKQLQPLPQQYIWVNIPSYQLQLWDSGIVVLTSKVVVGKPQTRT